MKLASQGMKNRSCNDIQMIERQMKELARMDSYIIIQQKEQVA